MCIHTCTYTFKLCVYTCTFKLHMFGKTQENFLFQEVHPTLFLGVPRVWEKIQTAIELRSQTNGRLKTFVMDMAKVGTVM